jgi:ATP-dependent Lon protease
MSRPTKEAGIVHELPLLPLRGVLVFPYMVIHLDVGRDKSIQALEDAMINDKLILLVSQKDAATDQPEEEDMYKVGTIAEVKQLIRIPGGAIKVLVEGLTRGKIERFLPHAEHFQVKVTEIVDRKEQTSEITALMRSVVTQFEQYSKLSKKVSPETLITTADIEEGGQLADIVVAHLNLKLEEKQDLLETFPVKERLEKILMIVTQENEILDLERKLNIRVRRQMEKTQKEYYLREQLKAIQKELGEKDDKQAETDEMRDKLAEMDLPEDVREKIEKEIERMEKMPPMAAEAVVVRTYLDWVMSLPWNTMTDDRLDINFAQEILDEDHYGLEKVKERILEFLAVRALAKKMKGPILCLVGPPGVGKTSLAKSVARALGKKYVRISLGGVRDEAEIRGHRRTYIGAMPGRIIQGMKQAGSKNPVFLMDEIDKMSTDFRGDPASALLEVLDPEQNNTFSDHYIEIPFDLSKVMFITTANAQHNIPRPLLDRMEVIYISGYTEVEKMNIGMKYLLPKQLKEHGLQEKQVSIDEDVLYKIIREYTREAGVRNLERELASICRKAARKIVQNDQKRVRLTEKNLRTYLGIPRYRYGTAEKEHEVGMATGVAWTETGGDILSIEVSLMKGKGNLTLTGKLGDVMKESAQAGFSYIRVRAAMLNIEDNFQETHDVHIHIPEGAIPKDGPSAGITMVTAMVSALTNRPVRSDVAMTGEITLRGRVLPVGGIKEKVLAAHRAGIKVMILPAENKKDLEEIPESVQKRMDFRLVEHMDEVLKIALV